MRPLIAPALALSLVALSAGTAAADTTVVHAAICEGTGNTDTVKVKRLTAAGGATTVADTGVANCGLSIGDEAFRGLASDQGHIYFATARTDTSQVRIGRVGRDGSGLTPSFISIPAPVRNIYLSPVAAGGYLYAYVNNCTPLLCGAGDLGTAKVVRVATSGGSPATVLEAPADSNAIPFGVGYDGVYFVDTSYAWHTLQRVPLAGGAPTTVFSIGSGPPAPDGFQNYDRVGRVANLVATPGATAYIGLRKTLAGETQPGIGTFDVGSPGTTYQQYGGAPLQDMNMWISSLTPGADGSALFVRGLVDSGPWTIGRADVGKSPEYNAYPGAASTAPILSLTSYPPWPAALGPGGSGAGGGPGGSGAGGGAGSANALDPGRIPPALTPRYRGRGGVPDVDVPCSAGPGARLNNCQATFSIDGRRLTESSRAGDNATKPARRVVIGSGRKTASGAETITVRVRITNAKARRSLARGSLRVQVALRATTADGQVLTTSDSLTLRKAKRATKK